jgi:hypothetical protein
MDTRLSERGRQYHQVKDRRRMVSDVDNPVQAAGVARGFV